MSKVKYPSEDFVGKKFGRLTVKGMTSMTRCGGPVRALQCVCDCGKEHFVTVGDVLHKKKPTRSCGCLRKDTIAKMGRRITHNMSRTKEYKSWIGMRARCKNPKDWKYYLYGGRGINVCDQWDNSFEKFFEDMGKKPFPRATLDRIDCNGDYDPSNCRWSDYYTQNNNKCNSVKIAYDGKVMGIAEWARELGVLRSLLRRRLLRGLSAEEVLKTPSRSKRQAVVPPPPTPQTNTGA